MPSTPAPKNIEWTGGPDDGYLRLLDQTKLPGNTVFLDCRTVSEVANAIKRLSVRGAPAIGIAAAYACVIAAQERPDNLDDPGRRLDDAIRILSASRPTAVNLFWALQRMKQVDPCTPKALLIEAIKIHDQDAAMCRRIGEIGLPLLQRHAVGQDQLRILTHCNAGALATGGVGTATAPIYLAHERGLPIAVFADETRPLLQGSRLTAFELAAAGVDVTVICDSMAAQVMRERKITAVITGADRIAANGDAANKIGTYNLAVLAHHHGLPFYVAAPSSTFDLSLADGSAIPIEQRAPEEILAATDQPSTGDPDSPTVRAYNPAFDVTPHELITAIITDRGVIEPVNLDQVKLVLARTE